MPKKLNHWGIFVDNDSDKVALIHAIQYPGTKSPFKDFKSKEGKVFSPLTLQKFVDEEERHNRKIIEGYHQPLKTMSSGEQKKALLFHILKSQPDYIILDNPFDNLDSDFQEQLKQLLISHAETITLIQLCSRKVDILPFVNSYGIFTKNGLSIVNDSKIITDQIEETFRGKIPEALESIEISLETLVHFKSVYVSYGERKILDNINWKIKKGEFWQLLGPNGSGKTTLLSMITGDNPKAYGQEIYLFGRKKGTGESVWDIKQKLGYYSPAMTDKFAGRHTVEHMLISGLTDSIGLYQRPTETQKRYIKKWLVLLNFWEIKDVHFKDLSLGKQRLVMTARAMVKHPSLLILDEPTAGMDDRSAQLLVALVNKIAKETKTAIVFVSHRTEPGLHPKKTFQLQMTKEGSVGIVRNL
ncbi:ATP-binding cassette domain-containing protein [Maribacter aestuarii]|uniref:ATP-binding cassette domain-containing protein n=1 Tax=Maribacter aestuarii TaxID=1130723 RepID=UPI0025A60820|nr:ATP-binding cassette domain-containing protein [Maribacter aestuarii]